MVLFACPRRNSLLVRMRLLSFTTPAPVLSNKQSSATVSKCPTHHSVSIVACRHSRPPYSLESHLLALSADDAASAAKPHPSSLVTASSPSSTWPVVLHAFAAAAIVGAPLSRLVLRLGFDAFLDLSPHNICSILYYLRHRLNMTFAQRRRIVTNNPHILTFDPASMLNTINALGDSGLSPTQIRNIVLRWPDALRLSPSRIRRVANYFTRPPVSLSHSSLVPLLRRAPWVFAYDVDHDLAPVVNWLYDNVPLSALEKIVTSNPRVFPAKREQLSKVRDFLHTVVGLSPHKAAITIASYPPLLTLPVDTVLVPAVHALLREVPLTSSELANCVRAFPAILSLDPEATVLPVINFFRKHGVVNVARIVIRLPPVLGYDVETNLAPKMKFILRDLGLDIFHVLKFPGLFSHPLENCIKPRTRFAILQGKSISEIGLSQIVSLPETEFSERLIGVPVSTYHAFCRNTVKGEASHASVKDPTVPPSILERKSRRKNSKNSALMSGEERRVWGQKKYRATLTRMPWTDLP